MAGTGESAVNMLNWLREVSESGDPVEGGFTVIEAHYLKEMGELSAHIEWRHQTDPSDGGWRSREEARAMIERLDDRGQRQQFRNARDALLADIARVPIAWNEMFLLGESATVLIEAWRSLVLTTHNPVIQESMLIPVADEREELVREMFAEFSGILWGFGEVLAGLQGQYHRTYLAYLADEWEMTLEALADYLGLSGGGPADDEERERAIQEYLDRYPNAERWAVEQYSTEEIRAALANTPDEGATASGGAEAEQGTD